MFEQKRYPFLDEIPKRFISKTKGKLLLWINRIGVESCCLRPPKVASLFMRYCESLIVMT